MDSCPKYYRKFFEDIFGDQCSLIEVNNAGNFNTFGIQLDILSKAESEILFFVEDDYIFLRPLKELVDVMNKTEEINFLTPYYHPDYDLTKWHVYKSKFLNIDGIELKSVSSTTLTFFAKKNALIENLDKFKLFASHRLGDYQVWLLITKYKKTTGMGFLRTSYFWFRTFRYLINYKSMKKYMLFVPIKSYAVHLAKGYFYSKINMSEEEIIRIVTKDENI